MAVLALSGLTSLVMLPSSIALADPSLGQTNQSEAHFSTALPSVIVTTDGRTYKNAELLRITADGLVVQYRPDAGGIGVARLDFAKLSQSLQKQFGYDPAKALTKAKAQAPAMAPAKQGPPGQENTLRAIRDEISHLNVSIKASAPTVTYTNYDPAGPPPPRENPDWTGWTSYSFEFDAKLSGHRVLKGPGEPFNFHFDEVDISLALPIIITVPTGKPGKINQHEEGHRTIDEYFYSLATPTAKRVIENLTDDELRSFETNSDSTNPDVIGKEWMADLRANYWKQTQDLCMQANHYYDELTDHGKNNLDSDEAAQTAIRRYAP